MIEQRFTLKPNGRLRHGFALYTQPLAGGASQLIFVAGQFVYVSKRIKDVPPSDVIIPFTENGNPIDLRNNWQTKGNERLIQHFGSTKVWSI
jgi:hypothetical protein